MLGRIALATVLALAVGSFDLPGRPSGAVEAAQSTAPAASAGLVVYSNNNDIWTMNADGSNQTQLTHVAQNLFANDAVFSPDGTKIAYTVHQPWTQDNWGGSEIHIMNIDGTNDRVALKPTRKSEWMDMPAWYAAGTQLFYSHDVPQFDASGNWTSDTITLEALDMGTGQRTVLQNNAENPTTAANGTLAWVSFTNGQIGFQLNVITPNSQPKTILSDKDFLQIWQPRLSPDGQWIAFSGSGRSASSGGSSGLFGALSLVPTASAHGLPWDPWIIKVDGTGLRKLASIGSDEQAVTWSPDGQTVGVDDYDGVFAIPAAGGGLAKIVAGGQAGGLDWRDAWR